MRTALTRTAATLSFIAMASAAFAYQPITDRETFLNALGDRNLSNRLYAVELSVSPDGAIAGSGAGWEILGTWYWQDGFFCREMTWGGDPIPFNCQLVEFDGRDMRFTTDQGAGDSASFRLR